MKTERTNNFEAWADGYFESLGWPIDPEGPILEACRAAWLCAAQSTVDAFALGDHFRDATKMESNHFADAGQIIYLSGPMTGLPELNFPAFHAAARRLRALGWQVVNPAEINTDPAATWHQCLRNDLIALAGCCDVLALMPGWQTSRGAHLELHVARELGLRIVTVEELEDIHA